MEFLYLLLSILAAFAVFILIGGLIYLWEYFTKDIYTSTDDYRIKKLMCGRYIVERLYLCITGFKKRRGILPERLWIPCHADGDPNIYGGFIYPDCYLSSKEEAIERINQFRDGERYYYPEDYIERDS